MSAVSDDTEPETVLIQNEAATPVQDENKRKLSESDTEVVGNIHSSSTNEASPSKRIKVEPNEAEPSESESRSNEGNNPTDLESGVIIVKTEPGERNDSSSAASTSADISSSNITVPVNTGPGDDAKAPAAVKTEPVQTNGQGQQIAPVNDSAVVSSSTIRPSCRFGIRCYRRNLAHRSVEAHPGDDDYRRPNYPEPPLGTPPCPFGNLCYRRNPLHFQQHSHPPDFNSAQNIRNRLRQRRAQQQRPDDPDSDVHSEDEEDPFGGDSDRDDEYKPGDELDDDDEDEELEFDSQRVDCDKYD